MSSFINEKKENGEKKEKKENGEKKNRKKEEITEYKVNKRLLKDVIDILKHPLISEGIYYSHDENDSYKGYAMIIGPDDTIYKYGYYFFKFTFPQDYPFSPPKAEYLTNGDNIRFNPNLYRNGKVCISILNTWKGEQWTSCQTIRSVLISLLSLFHNKPLLNEPGITEKNKYFKIYNEIIEYSNYNIAINKVLKQDLLPLPFNSYWSYIKGNIIKNKNNILDQLNKLNNKYSEEIEKYCGIYNMRVNFNYKKIKTDFEDILFILEKTNTKDNKKTDNKKSDNKKTDNTKSK